MLMKKAIAVAVFAIVLAFTATVRAQVPLQEFKPGAYGGTMTITTTIENVGANKSTLKLKGRVLENDTTTLRLIGAPQAAASVLASTDDLPVKRFDLYFEDSEKSMSLAEVPNLDATGNIVAVFWNRWP